MKIRCKRYQSPDGLDWRDPNMPVLRYGSFDGKPYKENRYVAPNHIQQYYIQKLEQVGWQMPDWKESLKEDNRYRRNKK